jgi:hypothetical protein
METTEVKTIDLAAAMSRRLLGTPNGSVKEVYLFGGIARTGDSLKDVDLIVVTDDVLFEDYAARVWTLLPVVCGTPSINPDNYLLHRERLACISRTLGDDRLAQDLGELTFRHAENSALHVHLHVDLHLFPQGWQGKPQAIQAEIPFRDPNFVSKVARDARRFRQTNGSGVFDPPRV